MKGNCLKDTEWPLGKKIFENRVASHQTLTGRTDKPETVLEMINRALCSKGTGCYDVWGIT